MLDALTQRLSSVVKTLRGHARLTEENVQEMLREVRLALLDADAGSSTKRPPPSLSSRAANTLGESRSGRHNQSIAPSRATSATVRPSPMAP